MKKDVFQILFTVFFASNAYGAFNFENYSPTLGHNHYELNFVQVSDSTTPENIIKSYNFDTSANKWTPVQYAVSYHVNPEITSHEYVANTNNGGQNISGLFHGTNITNFASYGNNIVPTLGNIDADFIDLNNAAISNGQDGLVIYPVIGDITGDFIATGGINNDSGVIGDINANFINNYSGIMNDVAYIPSPDNPLAWVASDTLPVIGDISGNFINNKSNVITNMGVIGDISGDFIDNHANYGISVIRNDKTIGNITGDVINNYVNWDPIYDHGDWNIPYGIFLTNNGNVKNITGNFIHNIDHRKSMDGLGTGLGAVIFNQRILGDISGNFYNNLAVGIYNSNTVGNIVGDFINNQDVAIYNLMHIGDISGNFIGNSVNRNNFAAITNNTHDWVNSPLRFLSESANYTISDNYNIVNGVRHDVAIYSGINTRIFFDNRKHTHYTVNDKIEYFDLTPELVQPTIQYMLDITGDGTGYTQFNNTITNAQNVNITNGKMVFGKTPDTYTGTPSIGGFAGIAPILTMENGTFDIANGYTETVNLNKILTQRNKNYISIDLDIKNHLADMIKLEAGVVGTVRLNVNALADLDIDNYVIWFAQDTASVSSPFKLNSVSGVHYGLDIYTDAINHRFGLVKKGNWHPVDFFALLTDGTTDTMTRTVQKLTNSMQKRVGELQWLSKNDDNWSDPSNAFWTRGIYKNFDTNNSTVGLYGMEFGYDRMVAANNALKWYVGALGYLFDGDSTFKEAQLNISGFGVGLYTMLLERTGWFADLVFRQHFITNEIAQTTSEYSASSLNMEIGKEFIYGDDTDCLKWFIKPSVEGTYIHRAKADIGYSITIYDSTSQMYALSVLAGPRWDLSNGKNFQAYGKLGYTIDNSDDVDAAIHGVDTTMSVAKDTIETGIGLNYRSIDNSTNVYMELSYISGTDYSEISGNMGLRYAF